MLAGLTGTPTGAAPGSSSPAAAKNAIIVADFVNNTGDPVFETTLNQALGVQLGQSPVLDIVSPQHGDYRTAKMPPVNHGLLDGQLAWRQHDGGHTDAPNMKWFIQWADKFIGLAPPQ
jgi:hypothetical protein